MLYNAPTNSHVQQGWASCSKCQGMHFGGIAGVCPAGGAHDAAGSFRYAMAHDLPAAADFQDQFRSCASCQQLFYGPFGGKCPATGRVHNPTNSFNYTMPVDSYGKPELIVTAHNNQTGSELTWSGSGFTALTGGATVQLCLVGLTGRTVPEAVGISTPDGRGIITGVYSYFCGQSPSSPKVILQARSGDIVLASSANFSLVC